MSPSDSLTLGEAVTRFISSTNNTGKAGSKGISVPEQQEVQRFVREAGRDQMVADITPYKIEDYSGKRSADSIKTLAPVKAFLGYLHSEGHSAFKLADAPQGEALGQEVDRVGGRGPKVLGGAEDDEGGARQGLGRARRPPRPTRGHRGRR